MKATIATPSQANTEQAVNASIALAQTHYENFPVGSILLPKALRKAVAVIYSFARQADDFADEGDASIDQRLAQLQTFRDELDLIQAYIQPNTALFVALKDIIVQHQLPIKPFYDLLDAFSQDVVKTRYANFAEVLDYCARSANPIGVLMLHLYGNVSPDNIVRSNHICSALQLINFYQDIAIDFEKNDDKRRIYLCQNEMLEYGISEKHIAHKITDAAWQNFMQFNLNRAEQLLKSGKPLGRSFNGRIGFELRMMIAGGERILYLLKASHGDIYKQRPQLKFWDWICIVFKAL